MMDMGNQDAVLSSIKHTIKTVWSEDAATTFDYHDWRTSKSQRWDYCKMIAEQTTMS